MNERSSRRMILLIAALNLGYALAIVAVDVRDFLWNPAASSWVYSPGIIALSGSVIYLLLIQRRFDRIDRLFELSKREYAIAEKQYDAGNMALAFNHLDQADAALEDVKRMLNA